MPSGHLSWFFSREIVPVARRVRRGFCQSWQELVELFEYRGTMPISGRELIPVQNCFKWALARSLYEHSKSVLDAEAKAKTMTSLFTLLSVLAVDF
jgi:CDP-glycerol glycerophosphotransferase (TagB/SpsB family)